MSVRDLSSDVRRCRLETQSRHAPRYVTHISLRLHEINISHVSQTTFHPLGFSAHIYTVGKLSLSSPDHISLLLHRTFNVSIPRHHIPVDEWVFEYGPAENDPEFGAGTAEGQGEGEDAKGEMSGEGGSGGRWVHKVTGINLGDASGSLEFTVVGFVNPAVCLLSFFQ